MNTTRPMAWSVRREIWENRSIYLAPLIVTAVVLFATMISTVTLPRKLRSLPPLEPAKQHAAMVRPVSLAPAPIMLTAILVGFFYSLDALYGERRDRAILFWKSLPVSDATTVLSKVAVPAMVLPAIALVLSVITQLILLFESTLILLGSGLGAGRLWSEFRFFEGLPIMVYGLAIHTLWFLPINAWLLLISAWARRATLLWAILPLLAIGAVEKILFNTTYFMSMLRYRFVGAMIEGFGMKMLPGHSSDIERLSQLTPIRFLGSAGLWTGLIFAAMFIAAAIRLRRNREPI